MEPVLLKTNKGQALMETLFALPLLAVFSSALLFCFYFLLAILWADHWVYRANICLVEGGSRWTCERDLNQKMQILIPPHFYVSGDLWFTPRHSHVSVTLHFAGRAELEFLGRLRKVIASDLDLPLRSSSLMSMGSL